ncbi:MAG: response regulator, partial [Pseudomonadota bacterium]
EALWSSRSRRMLARRRALIRLDYLTMVYLNLVLVITYMALSVFLVLEQTPLLTLAAVLWVAGGIFAAVLVLVPDRLLMATTYGPAVAAMIAVANLIDWSWRGGAVTPDAALTLAISLFFAMFVIRAFMMAGEFQRQAYADKQALEMRRAAAERASVNKTAFLARMSHEIRTPLNGVLGCAGLLAETDLEPRQRHLSDQILRSGETLLSVLNDVLDISKIEVGGLELDTGPINVSRLFQDCVNLILPEAEQKGVIIRMQIDNRLPDEIMGDAPRIRQIVINLLSNAVKFNATGEVSAALWSDGTTEHGRARMRIEVFEAGPGMAPLLRYGPYNPFAESSDERQRFEKSAGLGLIISRDLAEQMEGTMTLEECDPVGYRLDVSLPVAAASGSGKIGDAWRPTLSGKKLLIISEKPPFAAEILGSLGAVGIDVVWVTSAAEARGVAAALTGQGDGIDLAACSHELLGVETLTCIAELRKAPGFAQCRFILDCGLPPPQHLTSSALFDAMMVASVMPTDMTSLLAKIASQDPDIPQTERDPADIPDLSGRRVILAEDDQTNQMLLKALLEPTGAEILLASDGRDVLRLLSERPADLILMDIRMPRMDGVEAARKIRSAGGPMGARARDLRIIAVTAHARKEECDSYLSAGMDDFLAKPVMVDDVYSLLRRHLPADA